MEFLVSCTKKSILEIRLFGFQSNVFSRHSRSIWMWQSEMKKKRETILSLMRHAYSCRWCQAFGEVVIPKRVKWRKRKKSTRYVHLFNKTVLLFSMPIGRARRETNTLKMQWTRSDIPRKATRSVSLFMPKPSFKSLSWCLKETRDLGIYNRCRFSVRTKSCL